MYQFLICVYCISFSGFNLYAKLRLGIMNVKSTLSPSFIDSLFGGTWSKHPMTLTLLISHFSRWKDSQRSIQYISVRCKPCSVPRVWSVAGPETLAGFDPPMKRLQLEFANGRGSMPHSEPWKVHSLSAGHELVSLLYTFRSSMAMLPWVPPTTASIINWRTYIYWGGFTITKGLNDLFNFLKMG